MKMGYIYYSVILVDLLIILVYRRLFNDHGGKSKFVVSLRRKFNQII